MDVGKNELYGSWDKSEPKALYGSWSQSHSEVESLYRLMDTVQINYEESSRREIKYRSLLMTGLATELEKPIILSKSDLLPGVKEDKSIINPDDQIEFKPTMNSEGKAILLIRNKTLADKRETQKLDGEVKRLTPDEVADFCWRNSGQKNIFHLEEVLRSGTFSEDQKFFGFLGAYREILGVAYVTEINSKSINLVRLFTASRTQNKGVARNLIESLKSRYSYIDLIARSYASDESDPTDGLTGKQLREFYMKSGFIPGTPFFWRDDCLSVDDVINAREWREIKENDSIGFGSHVINGREVTNAFLYKVDEAMPSELTRETKRSLFSWESAMSDSRNQKNDLDSLNHQIRGEKY